MIGGKNAAIRQITIRTDLPMRIVHAKVSLVRGQRRATGQAENERAESYHRTFSPIETTPSWRNQKHVVVQCVLQADPERECHAEDIQSIRTWGVSRHSIRSPTIKSAPTICKEHSFSPLPLVTMSNDVQ
jgi:hypothetical protein